MVGRLLMALGGFVALIAGLAWSRADSHEAPDPLVCAPPLVTGTGTRFFAAECAQGTAIIDLDLSPDAACELIVTSLGHFGTTFRVTMESQPIEDLEQEDRPLAALRPIGEPVGNRSPPRSNRVASPAGPAAIDDAASEPLPQKSSPPDSLGNAPRQREFFLHVTEGDLEDPRAYASVRSRMLAEGAHVRVYLDEQCRPAEIATGLAGEIVRMIDDEIAPRSRELIGAHRDVDGDGKLAVLLTPWLGKLRGGASTANGFVRGNDFEAGVPAPFSNHADLLYLNSTISAGTSLKALLAHEYTHAACFSVRLPNDARSVRLPDEDDWLNEAIAHVAENLHGADFSNLADRIDCFLAEPHKYPLVVRDYYRAGLWRDPGCRGATYLFLRWCVDRYGEKLLKELANNPVAGTRNLEWATGTPFADLYRAWTIALRQSHVSALSSLAQDESAKEQSRGPEMISWGLDLAGREQEVRGTATAFIKLCPHASMGRRRISLKTDPAAQLQVTLIRRIIADNTATSSVPCGSGNEGKKRVPPDPCADDSTCGRE